MPQLVYVGIQYGRPSNPTKWHLYPDCFIIAPWRVDTVDLNDPYWKKTLHGGCCKACAKRQAKELGGFIQVTAEGVH